LARVYLGAEDDQPLSAEHYAIDHLDSLLAGSLSPALRSLYSQEYSELRAAMRALAVVGLTRKDYYNDAAKQANLDAVSLRDALAFNEIVGTTFVASLDETLQGTLGDLEATHIDRKTEIVSRLQAASGFNSNNAAPLPEEIVRAAMTEVPGVNPKGVSSEQERDI
jgi:hypothetical protein